MTPVHSGFRPCRGWPSPFKSVIDDKRDYPRLKHQHFSEQLFFSLFTTYIIQPLFQKKKKTVLGMACFVFPSGIFNTFFIFRGTAFEKGILHLNSYLLCASSKICVLSIWATFHILWPPSNQRTAVVQEALFSKASSEAHAHWGKMKENKNQPRPFNFRLQSTKCGVPLTHWLIVAVEFEKQTWGGWGIICIQGKNDRYFHMGSS